MEDNKKNELPKDTDDIMNLIKRRRFQILVHSYIYYKLNDNIISNALFDKWSEELIELQATYPELSKKVVELYDAFSDFTIIGDCVKLPLDNDARLDNRARQLLRDYKKDTKEV